MEQDFSKEDWFVIDAVLQKVAESIRKIEAEERNETLVRIALDCARKGIPLPSDIRWQLTDEQWAMIRAGNTQEEVDKVSEGIRNLAEPEHE